MQRTKMFVAFIGCLVLGGALSRLPGQTPGAGLEQQLRSLYPITQVGTNGVVVRTGAVLAIQQDGIIALPAPSEFPCNTYKPSGKIKSSTLCAINYKPSEPQQIRLQVGGQVYLTEIKFKPTEIGFKLQTASANDAPYRATVAFQFGKGFQDSMKLKDIQDTIGQVLALDTSSPTQGPDQQQPNPGPGAQPTSINGIYNSLISQAQLEFNPDGSFAQHGPGTWQNSGTFTVNGDALTLTYPSTGRSSAFSIRGDTLYNGGGKAVWARKAEAETPAPSPVEMPLKLPATYVSAQAAADQLQLNGDHSFSLQEGGQAYHGTFTGSANTLKLTITDTNPPTESTATLQGRNLTDSSGQTWVLREQSAGTPPGGAGLQNQDIIKLVQSKVPDSVIIMKIKSSACAFDTGTDALVKLKQAGVSDAVLQAMVSK